MKRRLFNLAAAASLVMMLAVVGLWVRSYWEPMTWLRRDQHAPTKCERDDWFGFDRGRCLWVSRVHFSDTVKRTGTSWESCGRELDGSVPILNAYVAPNGYYVLGFIWKCDTLFLNAPGWERVIAIPMYVLCAVLAITPASAVWGALRREQWDYNGRCRRCGYDLRATLDRCPECGRIVAPKSAEAAT
jgi:hypothetical protein